MDIGRLRSSVVLQSPPAAQDEVGQPTGAWSNVATVWANVANLSGLQTLRAGAETSLVKASIRIRYRHDVAAGMRAVFGATTYRITAVLPDAKKRYVDLVAEVIQ